MVRVLWGGAGLGAAEFDAATLYACFWGRFLPAKTELVRFFSEFGTTSRVQAQIAVITSTDLKTETLV